ncbi:MAG TPA: FAD-dependent oxidoreductase, partial [Candidatus Hydrogenedentes bacterium]|nr:FAD-dependent oxidoreductase [Candidatus Hydrogenedentota bacterium]
MKRRELFRTAVAGGLAAALGMGASAQAQGEGPSPEELVWTRKVPVRWVADVAVIGGGIAGVTAAAAAARSGARVLLVERFAITGGMLTVGGVANFCGEMTGQGEVFDEILAGLRAWNAIGHERPSVFHYETLAVVLQELLLKRNIKLLLHT